MADEYKKAYKNAMNSSKGKQQIIVNSAMQWFYNKVRIASGGNVKNPNAYSTVIELRDGGLFTYSYHPKHYQTLKYYDTFPMIIPLEMYHDGWLGINLHYLPPSVRAVIFDDIVKGRKKNKSGLMVAYAWVKAYSKHPIIKHGIKRYLTLYVTSPIVKVDEDEWRNAIMMPTQTFMKKTDQYVWGDYK